MQTRRTAAAGPAVTAALAPAADHRRSPTRAATTAATTTADARHHLHPPDPVDRRDDGHHQEHHHHQQQQQHQHHHQQVHPTSSSYHQHIIPPPTAAGETWMAHPPPPPTHHHHTRGGGGGYRYDESGGVASAYHHQQHQHHHPYHLPPPPPHPHPHQPHPHHHHHYQPPPPPYHPHPHQQHHSHHPHHVMQPPYGMHGPIPPPTNHHHHHHHHGHIPPPPRKKPRRMVEPGGLEECGLKSSESIIREEMRNVVLSRLNLTTTEEDRDIDTNIAGSWCLVDGLTKCAMASDGVLLPLIKEHGPPPFYIDHIRKTGGGGEGGAASFFGDYSCKGSSSTNGDRSFVSLCHWVSRQQLADGAALTIWRRLLNVVGATEEDTSNLSPDRILSIEDDGDVESKLLVPSGLSKMKCKCIISIARCFRDGTISDALLFGGGGVSDDEVRSRLVAIKGVGPWTVDMFLLFNSYRSDVLPIGDLAVRKGTSKVWGLRGHAKGGGLCPMKDKHIIEECHRPFAPYRSISSYYMYK